MKEKNKTYTAADFARYHAGTMPAGEMHELEKAALEDPFLEDALEGYVHTPAFESDLKELNDRLTEKRKKKKVFFLSSLAENRWWRIAALFIIISGVGYLFYVVNYVGKNKSLAKNEIKVSADRADTTSIIKPGSAIRKNDSSLENQRAFTSEQRKEITLPPAKPSIKKGYFESGEEEKSTALSSLNKPNAGSFADSTYIEKSKNEKDRHASKDYIIEEKVTDDKDKDVQANTAMNKTNANLNEVVVTRYGKRKQFNEPDSLSNILNGKVAGLQITPALPQPLGGQEKFDQYLKENTTQLFDTNGERLTGEILLSFTINKKGKPENIKVLKSSCSACEKEAIKLLKNGPKWTGKKGEPGGTVIKF